MNGRPREVPNLVIVLVTVAIVVTLGAIAIGFVVASRLGTQAAGPSTGPLAVPATPAPGASGRYCTDLFKQLPDDLGAEARRTLIVDEPGVAAWGDPAIILRCGLPDPAELTCSANLTTFTDAGGVSTQWLRIAAGSSVTYLAVDRPVRVAVTVPDSAGITPVQDLADSIARSLPARDVCQAGALVPSDNS